MQGGGWGRAGVPGRRARGLPAAASPTSEVREEEIVALLQKGISIQLSLGYKYRLTCLCGKARVWSAPELVKGSLNARGGRAEESCTLGRNLGLGVLWGRLRGVRWAPLFRSKTAGHGPSCVGRSELPVLGGVQAEAGGAAPLVSP